MLRESARRGTLGKGEGGMPEVLQQTREAEACREQGSEHSTSGGSGPASSAQGTAGVRVGEGHEERQ